MPFQVSWIPCTFQFMCKHVNPKHKTILLETWLQEIGKKLWNSKKREKGWEDLIFHANFINLTKDIAWMLSLHKSKGKWKILDSSKSFETKTRKPKQVSWENFEIIALINAKKFKHEANLEIVDSWNNMETLVTKWKHIS